MSLLEEFSDYWSQYIIGNKIDRNKMIELANLAKENDSFFVRDCMIAFSRGPIITSIKMSSRK